MTIHTPVFICRPIKINTHLCMYVLCMCVDKREINNWPKVNIKWVISQLSWIREDLGRCECIGMQAAYMYIHTYNGMYVCLYAYTYVYICFNYCIACWILHLGIAIEFVFLPIGSFIVSFRTWFSSLCVICFSFTVFIVALRSWLRRH